VRFAKCTNSSDFCANDTEISEYFIDNKVELHYIDSFIDAEDTKNTVKLFMEDRFFGTLDVLRQWKVNFYLQSGEYNFNKIWSF